MKAPSHYSEFPVDQLADRLWAVAASQGLVQYNQVSEIVGKQPSDPTFWAMLGEITEDTNTRFGVMLTAVVVNKRDGFPGGEFFDLAIELNRGLNDQLEFWAREVQAVHAKAAELSVNGKVKWL